MDTEIDINVIDGRNAWTLAMDQKPAWVSPYLGARGMPPPWCDREGPIGQATAGLDRWHANNFVAYRPETADFLYGEYAQAASTVPTAIPQNLAAVVAETVGMLKTPREQFHTLVTQVLPTVAPHPTVPPLGPRVVMNRGLDDAGLLASGAAWCNEQARLLVRLCQLLGMPGRLVFLFYSDRQTGHTIAEIQVDGQWCMVDSTYAIYFTGEDGRLLSAAECHAEPCKHRYVGPAYRARVEALLAMSDEDLVGGAVPASLSGPERQVEIDRLASKIRTDYAAHTADFLADRLWTFGLMNYPWPAPAPALSGTE